jgi:pimeloyl-ACP methyl ester carboxylesterase
MPETITLNIEGHKLAALALNPGADGEPLILIHGITSSIYNWIPEQQPLLLARGPCYALSLPGHYPAAFPPGFQDKDLTAETIARLMTAAIRELAGQGPVTLVGHSTGGFAALDIAAYTPGLARRILCIAGFAQGQWIGPLGLYQRLARSGSLGTALFKSAYSFSRTSPATFRYVMRFYVNDVKAFYNHPFTGAALEAIYPAFQKLDLDAMATYFRVMPDTDISDKLPMISAATLAIAGDRDNIVPPAQARLIAERVPNAALALVAGAGHLPFTERAEEYDRIVTDWFERTD